MNNLSVHETLELHELLNFKINCLNKAKAFYHLVSDSQLQNILKQDISTTTNDIIELKQLLQEQTF